MFVNKAFKSAFFMLSLFELGGVGVMVLMESKSEDQKMEVCEPKMTEDEWKSDGESTVYLDDAYCKDNCQPSGGNCKSNDSKDLKPVLACASCLPSPSKNNECTSWPDYHKDNRDQTGPWYVEFALAKDYCSKCKRVRNQDTDEVRIVLNDKALQEYISFATGPKDMVWVKFGSGPHFQVPKKHVPAWVSFPHHVDFDAEEHKFPFKFCKEHCQ